MKKTPLVVFRKPKNIPKSIKGLCYANCLRASHRVLAFQLIQLSALKMLKERAKPTFCGCMKVGGKKKGCQIVSDARDDQLSHKQAHLPRTK